MKLSIIAQRINPLRTHVTACMATHYALCPTCPTKYPKVFSHATLSLISLSKVGKVGKVGHLEGKTVPNVRPTCLTSGVSGESALQDGAS